MTDTLMKFLVAFAFFESLSACASDDGVENHGSDVALGGRDAQSMSDVAGLSGSAPASGGDGGTGGAKPNGGGAGAMTLDASPDYPPAECILPCVWDVIKNCRTPLDPADCSLEHASDANYLCDGGTWLARGGRGAWQVYQNSQPCYEYSLGQRATVWRRADGQGGWTQIAVLVPAGTGSQLGMGTCYSEGAVVFEHSMDFAAAACDPWRNLMGIHENNTCDNVGACPRPLGYEAGRPGGDAASTDAAPTDVSDSGGALLDGSTD